ncbi:hypothetical protein [Chlamydia sp.]|uniref:hypothetical protein n=1 Tax=Chlamydia sp. TaxID=35827 RepID=UPI0025BF4180|nr:hypothetical protein [Chlamydia sp.]MBQ8498836.1 hypothetical protein [Chlamydia sp.]
MIDPLKLFPNFDGDQENVGVNKPAASPMPSELSKNIASFSLGGENAAFDSRVSAEKLSLMAMMQDKNSKLIDPELEEALDSEELQEQIHLLKHRLWDAQMQMQNQNPDRLAAEHMDALDVIVNLINGDLQTIAEHTQQTIQHENSGEERSVTRKMVDWVSSGEEILNRALLYFSDRNGERETLADFLKVQYAVQRATQRAELFASILGATVSSIKTIMTTQLG